MNFLSYLDCKKLGGGRSSKSLKIATYLWKHGLKVHLAALLDFSDLFLKIKALFL